jgi:hypothetical protein
MNLKNKMMLLIFVILITDITFSQTNNNDFSTWLSAELNYKLNKKWTFGVQEQLRLKENASTTDSYFTQFSASYKITKGLDLGVGYRYIKFHDNHGAIQGYNDFGRLQFDLSYGHKLSNFALKYRVRYQTKNQLGVPDNPKENIRFKTSIGYNIKGWKLDPKFSAEIYNRIGAANTAKNGFTKYRLTLGTAYDTKNTGKFSVFYRIEKDLNTINHTTNEILGIKYSYTIKNKRKRNKK